MKACEFCLKEKDTSSFLKRGRRASGSIRRDKVCCSCRSAQRKNRRNLLKSSFVGKPLHGPCGAAVTRGYYKSFTYPNGEVVNLTKTQFLKVVSYFEQAAVSCSQLKRLGRFDESKWFRVVFSQKGD